MIDATQRKSLRYNLLIFSFFFFMCFRFTFSNYRLNVMTVYAYLMLKRSSSEDKSVAIDTPITHLPLLDINKSFWSI